MATIGHIAVGMAAGQVHHEGGRRQWSQMAFWSILSALPDADYLGLAFGIAYADPLGHRGATHSFAFSIGLGLLIGVAARWFKRPGIRTALMASVVLSSHALLDSMTHGGLGCALWWPFDSTRYFAPWRPIMVAPAGLYLTSSFGLQVLAAELVLFSPLLVFALGGLKGDIPSTADRPVPRRLRGVLIALWLVSAWLITCGLPYC